MKQTDWHHSLFMSAFEEIRQELGEKVAHRTLSIIVMTVGGMRLSIPDLQDLWRQERNRRIRNEFTGFNYEELAIKYRLKRQQVRKIIQGGVK